MIHFGDETEDVTAEPTNMKNVLKEKYDNARPISLITLEQTNSFKDGLA